ncbi:MAG: hypothetical protein EBR82_52295 [Caulobacteraceae bacterium]|nr:hypothetical protein [Caulobacteraceae bacterium]
MDIITVKDMLTEMEKGKPFQIAGITYDKKRGKGGTRYDFQGQLIQAVEGEKVKIERSRPATLAEQGKVYKKSAPNHLQWFTRNVAICQDGVRTCIIRKIHIPLVVYFNAKIVVP